MEKAKNIYLINEEMLSVMSDHQKIEMQINIFKSIKSYGKALERIFSSIEKMNDTELIRNKQEIEDAINGIDIKLGRFGMGILSLVWFWKEGGRYECILESLKNKGFKFTI